MAECIPMCSHNWGSKAQVTPRMGDLRGIELPLQACCPLCPFQQWEVFRRKFPKKLDSFKGENSRTPSPLQKIL